MGSVVTQHPVHNAVVPTHTTPKANQRQPSATPTYGLSLPSITSLPVSYAVPHSSGRAIRFDGMLW